ncbi:30S ribosomal protein S8 [Candidatus Woesebacteria bacterium]|nr:30S ribosomal protein S8 [Candidatus Woesebacteria bacterium]
MTNYPIGDFLIRIKNTSLAGKEDIEIPSSKLIKQVAALLKKAGFLREISEKENVLSLSLTKKNKKPRLLGLKLVSKPGLRIYTNIELLSKKRGVETWILSTPKGVMTDRQALKENVGGEIIAKVW